MKSMTKSELIEILSARHSQLAPKDAELAVKTMLDAMAHTLAQGDRIEIRGFGSFGLNYRPPRMGRNPKTGEKVQVPKKYVPHFKAGKEHGPHTTQNGCKLLVLWTERTSKEAADLSDFVIAKKAA